MKPGRAQAGAACSGARADKAGRSSCEERPLCEIPGMPAQQPARRSAEAGQTTALVTATSEETVP
ncbi:hypothetical protein GCM10010341_56030 [Streptomyces noursei]|nr:hypothetical protein GCM10010341_56030 [Streptomyces noursei]